MTTRLVITRSDGEPFPINTFRDYPDATANRIAAAVRAAGHRVDVRRLEEEAT